LRLFSPTARTVAGILATDVAMLFIGIDDIKSSLFFRKLGVQLLVIGEVAVVQELEC